MTTRIGEIVGYRCWKPLYAVPPFGTVPPFGEFEMRLTSIVMHYDWLPGANKAIEFPPSPGDVHDVAGFYAFKEPDAKYLQRICLNGLELVIGSVFLWGEVVEHEDGYRAEFARIRSLDHFPRHLSEKRREELKRRFLQP